MLLFSVGAQEVDDSTLARVEDDLMGDRLGSRRFVEVELGGGDLREKELNKAEGNIRTFGF